MELKEKFEIWRDVFALQVDFLESSEPTNLMRPKVISSLLLPLTNSQSLA